MVQVLETLKELDVEPVVTRGTAEFLRRSMEAGLGGRFPQKPKDLWEVPEELERLRA
jgi:hypothetical protein